MKQRHRAYASPANMLRVIGSLLAAGPILALEIHPGAAVRALFVVTAGLGLAFQGASFVPGEVVVGDDGVLVRSLWKRTFIPRRALATIDYASGKKLRIVEKSGAAHDLLLLRESGVGPLRGALAQLVESAASASERAPSATRAALASRALAWASSGSADVDRGPEIAYRRDEPEEHLWEIAEDVDAEPLARAGALLALEPDDETGRTRAKRIAENAAHPVVVGAFDAAARGDRDALRQAIARGLRAPTPASKVSASAEADVEGGQAGQAGRDVGVLRPPRALHALAWLSNLWFLVPILAVALRSLPLGIAAVVMGIVGAMPWVAVREYDARMRFVAGAVTEEDGFLVQEGRRLLALTDVKRAYVHRAPGNPEVVRFEGRGGWVLLDVRVGGPRTTRAFYDRLPLTEAQRTVQFSTMQTSKPFHAAMVAVLTLTMGGAFVGHKVLPGWAMGTMLGLALALVRVPRFVTPRRDGLAIRALGSTRVVRYDDIAAVERRKGAGTVVTKEGERIMLRGVSGDLTSAPDDDLTETVIDRWTAWRAAKARIRVAAEGREGKEEAKGEEGRREEGKEEEKREKEARAEEEAREEEENRGEGEEERKRRIS